MRLYENYLPILRKSNLFSGVAEYEIGDMMSCLNPRLKHFEKNESILRAGEQLHSIGMIVQGTAIIQQEDFWGNVSVLDDLHPGLMFAEIYAAMSQIPMDITVLATSDCDVMFFDISELTTQCGTACNYHSRLIQNIMTSIARKNIALNQKIDCISKRTIRDKLLAYLSAESIRAHSSSFDIPFNRQQLADYLFVDRSALSNEISKLTKEGVITSVRNHFEILENM